MTTTADEDSKRQERDRYAKAIRAWYASYKNVRLYSPAHPTSTESARKFVDALTDIFQVRFDFSLWHMDGLFVVDEFFFIEESLSFYDLLRSIETRGLEKFLFLPGITPEEVIACNTFLLAPATTPFTSHHLQTSVPADTHKKEKQLTRNALFAQSSRLYDEWLAITGETFSRLLDEQSVSLADLSLPLDRLIDAINQRPDDFSLMVCSRPLTKLHHQHSLHTLFLSVYVGQQMGFDPTSLKVLALAALFHDVGRLLLPSDFTTGYRLVETDADIIQLHARDGASFLAGVPGLPMSIVRAALEHHIGADGTGYPALPTTQKPHIFSQIIGLADFVSWSTVSENHYHKPHRIHRMVRTMLRRSGARFSPLLVKLLVPFFGLYPPGTLVRLTTGETAVCMLPNLHHIARPLVLIAGTDNNWTPRRLSAVAGDQAPVFPCSVARIVGAHAAPEALVPFLPSLETPA